MTPQNKFRNPEWMKINKCIKSCTNFRQLETLKELVMNYHDEKKQDAQELLKNFIERGLELHPENFTLYNTNPRLIDSDEARAEYDGEQQFENERDSQNK